MTVGDYSRASCDTSRESQATGDYAGVDCDGPEDGRSMACADAEACDDELMAGDNDDDDDEYDDEAERRQQTRARRACAGRPAKRGRRASAAKPNKPYSCGIGGCGRTFSSVSDAQTHRRTHTGEKPLLCKYCGCGFAHPSNRRQHERAVHEDVKRYACRYASCSKVYAHPTSRNDHEAVFHRGERPYHCDGCSMTFTARANRSRHVAEKCPCTPADVRAANLQLKAAKAARAKAKHARGSPTKL